MTSPLMELTDEMKTALGNKLCGEYDQLRTVETLKDDSKALKYIDNCIRRYSIISNTNHENRDSYLLSLRQHVAEVSTQSLTKADDLADKLKQVGIEQEGIEKITQAMGQPKEVLLGLIALVAIGTSVAVTSAAGGSKMHMVRCR